MTTLDEAIRHAEKIARSKCDECGTEHRQLAEWLKELREYKSHADAVNRQLKIGDEIYIRANVNEIRNDYIICENKGGYFGTIRDEIYPSVQPKEVEK